MKRSDSVFQVNLEGILRILSESLYSTPHVFIRELLQNSIDAITAREALESFTPEITLTFFANPSGNQGLIFSDNGIGLNHSEVEQFLSRIGSSSKSLPNLMDDRASYIGQFGIGMLSCFMASDEIIVRTQSAREGETAVKWIGKIDGTYSTEVLEDEQVPVGTSVVLTLRNDLEMTEDLLRALLRDYATFMRVPVRLIIDDRSTAVSERRFSWEEPANQLLFHEQGSSFFNEHFEFGIDIDLPEFQTKGKAYVLNRTTHYGEQGVSRIYIKRMLINTANTDLLPDWAFFVRLVIDSGHLAPTASREEVFKNKQFDDVREAIGKQLVEQLKRLGSEYPDILQRILWNHTIAFKSLAFQDADFAEAVVPMFLYETSRGNQTLGRLLQENTTLLYVTDPEEYHRMLPIARANDNLIINAGYIYDADIFDLVARTTHSHVVQRVNAAYFGNALRDADPDFYDRIAPGMNKIAALLDQYDCELQVKLFEPATVPAMYHLSDEARKAKDVSHIKETTDDLWSFVTDSVNRYDQRMFMATIVLNASNTVVERLLAEPDRAATSMIAETLLFNAMMQSNVPLGAAEQLKLNQNLIFLLENIK